MLSVPSWLLGQPRGKDVSECSEMGSGEGVLTEGVASWAVAVQRAEQGDVVESAAAAEDVAEEVRAAAVGGAAGDLGDVRKEGRVSCVLLIIPGCPERKFRPWWHQWQSCHHDE